jgi:hypothetical protein
MKFMALYRPGREGVAPPPQAEMEKLVEEQTRAGILIATGGFEESAKGARVRIAGGAFTVTDGPFTETKELITGFAIVRVASKAEAIKECKRFLALMVEGECEVRQMFDAEDFAPANG